MLKNKLFISAFVLGLISMMPGRVLGDASGFEVRLTYLPAAQDIGDWYEEYLEKDYGGYGSVEADVFVFPVGVSVAYRWDTANLLEGSFAYADLGPACIMIGDVSFWMVPIGGGVGYEMSLQKELAVFGKLGLRYPFADGDAVDGSSPGLLAAGGVEFGDPEQFQWFVEAAVDTSSITFSDGEDDEEIDLGFMLSVGIKFN